MRGNGQDSEETAPEAVLPEVKAKDFGTVIEIPPLRWGNRGNVISAAGAVLLDLVKVR